MPPCRHSALSTEAERRLRRVPCGQLASPPRTNFVVYFLVRVSRRGSESPFFFEIVMGNHGTGSLTP